MKKLPGRNTMAKRVAPGIWIDADGNHHFSATEIMELFGIENTPENLKRTMEYLKQVVAKHADTVIMRDTPED